MHRFFVPPDWIHGDRITFDDPIAHQLRSVLRMQPGSVIVALDNEGWAYTVELTRIGKTQAEGTITDRVAAGGEPGLRLTLFQCVLKKDNFEWVLQKGTEIGVTAFVPVISQRTIAGEVKAAKHDRWQRIITEAAEQSRRGRCPALHPPLPLAEAIHQAAAHHLALIPWEGESTHSLRAALETPRRQGVESAALIIGPEGGFAQDEIALAIDHHVRPVSLGPRILRAETAAIAAAALVIYELDPGWDGPAR